MKTYLLDVNVWIALAFQSHENHASAVAWLDAQQEATFAFCRTTQQGFLRIATNPKVPVETLTMIEAWETYDVMRRDSRIVFMEEPANLEQHWRTYSSDQLYSTHIWTDAYLAAFARAAGIHLITFDHSFSRYDGLVYSQLA